MLKIIVIVFFLQTTASLSTSSILYKEIFAYHNETAFKAEFAYQVVDKIYKAFKQWFFTIIFCEFTYFENRVLKYTETMDFGYPVMLLNGCPFKDGTKTKPKIDTHGQTAYVVTSNSLSLEVNQYSIEALVRTGVFKPRNPVIFVINVPVEVDLYLHYKMERHFQLLYSRRITNSVLILWSDQLRMYSYNPFFNKINDITNETNIGQSLSKIYNNLYGYELRLSVFRKIYVSDETGPVTCNSRLATTVMTFLNATCLPIAPQDGNTVGDLLENGTATGVTGELIDGYTDLELNSRILKNSYYGYIDTTYPFVQDELCLMNKKSGKQSTFITALHLISENLLLLFMFNVILLIATTLFVKKLEVQLWNIDDRQSTTSTLLDLIKCFLRQTVDIKFMGPIFRFMTLIIMIYSLIIDCAIDGIITSSITYPRYKADINTLNEFLKTNFTIGVHNRHMDLFEKSVDGDKNILDRVEVFNDKKIKQVIEEREFQYAVLMRKQDASYIVKKPANMRNGRPLWHIVKECPLKCSIVYGLQYGSPYLPRLTYILHHLNQAGILKHWTETEDYAVMKTLDKALDANKEQRALAIDNLKEFYYVFIMGLLLCFITFLCEIYVHKYFKLHSKIIKII